MPDHVQQALKAALAFAVAWLAIGLVLRRSIGAGDVLGAVLGGVVFYVVTIRRSTPR